MISPTLYTQSPTIQRSLREYSANGHKFIMIAIEKGSYLMQGDHEITFEEGFELGQYLVTQALWQAVMWSSPSNFNGPNRPVENVSWDDVSDEGGFLDSLNALPEIVKINKQDGCRFALPTEAQWEYSARGGRYGKDFQYKYIGSVYSSEVSWHDGNSQQQTQPIGRKLPNILGIFDMNGNLWEWCEDHWHYIYKESPADGYAWNSGEDAEKRMVHGGAWNLIDKGLGICFPRISDPANHSSELLGFRLARCRAKI